MSDARLTLAQAYEMLAEAFNEPVESLTPDRDREDIPGWDSMGALILIAELDERFGVELQAEASREMRKIQHVLDFLSTQGLLAA
ncbi:MAG: hypothetical protein RI907_2341 [Pseudomonadota bacterium]|jgi:acyl carrier protein